MEEPRVIQGAFTSGEWKRIKRKAVAVCLLCFAILASGLEEGDDAVNVISVENLDALLELRMVTELNLKNFTAALQRDRRGVRRGEDLCRLKGCDCVTDRRGVSCNFDSDKVLELGYGSLSQHHKHLTVLNLTELRILPGAFLDNPHLSRISLGDVYNVSIGREVVQSGQLKVDITDCRTVTLHDRSFSNVRNLLRVTIENSDSVSLRKSVFSPRLELQVINVPNLEIESNTFSAERKPDGSGAAEVGGAGADGPTRATPDPGRPFILRLFQINFHSVTVRRIPTRAFTMNGARISFVDCDIGTIDREAFRALELNRVSFHRTAIRRVETEAFSGQTGIRDVELNQVKVSYVAGRALSVASNLTISNSSLGEISDGAFNVTAAFLRLTRNRFQRTGRHAFAIQSWNSIVVQENEFESLKQDTFLAPFTKVNNVTNEFVFADNVVNETEVNALAFIPDDQELNVFVWNNTFQVRCHCHLESWLVTLSDEKWESFYDTSNCRITEFGSCYDLRGNYMNMRNYTSIVCDRPVDPDCEAIKVAVPGLPAEWDLKNTERTILGVVLLGVSSSVFIMILILTLSWLRHKATCSGLRRFATPSGICCFPAFNDSNLVASSSISRMNIHEYAEIQYQGTESQKQTALEIVICEDKATQTLPEELTQELLQSLREKLDDPENYTEARNMIEHLYDLIKVEESCNNNNVSRTSLLLEEEDEEEETDGTGNVYDVIARGPGKRSKKVRKVPSCNVTSTGTRAPSPDKLSPVAFHLPRATATTTTTMVTDYSEPQDRRSNEYCELPVSRDPVMPDVLGMPNTYAVPLKGNRMDKRPLPCTPSTSGDA